MINSILGFVLLFVKDSAKSAEFYSKLLGLEPVELYPTFALFKFKNDVSLGLWANNTAQPQVTAWPGASEIGFGQENIDALYEQLLALGIPMAQVPTDMNFGRTFVVLDPDGHRIRFYYAREK